MEKVVGASRTRIAARQHRETQRRKNALESSALPAKLADCRATDNERTELFIVEGDSALGTAKLARNSEFQALLPIRGKILNVQKASVGDMLKNAECASIIQVVGAGSGRTFDLDAAPLRPDHLHGRRRLRRRPHPLPAGDAVLQVHARPDRPTGRVFTAVPPLHRIELSNPKKGMDKYVYTYSDAELQRKLAELTQEGRALEGPGPALQGPRRDGRRPAGRDHDGPAAPHAAPDHRRRRRRRPREVFELLMGSDVAPRKEFIVQGAYEVDVDAHRRLTCVRADSAGFIRAFAPTRPVSFVRSRRLGVSRVWMPQDADSSSPSVPAGASTTRSSPVTKAFGGRGHRLDGDATPGRARAARPR